MLDLSRVQKELVDCNGDKSSGVSIELNGDDLSHLLGTISGPIATPYEGGLFRIDVRLPSNRFSPPIFLIFFGRKWVEIAASFDLFVVGCEFHRIVMIVLWFDHGFGELCWNLLKIGFFFSPNVGIGVLGVVWVCGNADVESPISEFYEWIKHDLRVFFWNLVEFGSFAAVFLPF